MRFSEWISLWRFDREVNIPHLSVTVMTPCCFVRVLWYHCPREFHAWPNVYETGIVLGWRWPWAGRLFKERAWLTKHPMPLAIYGGPVDSVYTQRAAADIGMFSEDKPDYDPDKAAQIGAVVRMIRNQMSTCPHAYWIASCPNCARNALLMAVELKPRLAPALRESEHDRYLRQIRERLTGAPALTIEQAENARMLNAGAKDAGND